MNHSNTPVFLLVYYNVSFLEHYQSTYNHYPNVYEGTVFQKLVDNVADEMLVFSDPGFAKKDWFPTNLKICPSGTWNDRMIIETVLSMLTTVCHFKKVGHRVWSYFKSRVGWTMALFNILVQWNGVEPDDTGFVSLSIANFSL
ncbi:MAG: hypothetical protein KAG20_00920 [Cocleimonas sp.]|nr:hypothetical protein [Cocleimonas sp.]